MFPAATNATTAINVTEAATGIQRGKLKSFRRVVFADAKCRFRFIGLGRWKLTESSQLKSTVLRGNSEFALRSRPLLRKLAA